MININNSVYVSTVPKCEYVVETMKENSLDTYVFIAPEIIE